MWIEHIGEIALGLMVILVLAHFGLHFLFKAQKAKKRKQEQKPDAYK